MKHCLLILPIVFVSACALSAQDANPLSADAKFLYTIGRTDIVRTAVMVPESIYSFKPTPEVRTFGEILGHIADAQYSICSKLKGEDKKTEIEKPKKSKVGLITVLNDAFAYCDTVYNGMTDAVAISKITYHGAPHTKMMVLTFNATHTMLHYGNLVTYMRLNGIVPPSMRLGDLEPASNEHDSK